MLSLGGYGSESDSEDKQPVEDVPKPAASEAKQSMGKKKEKGPVKIMLDLSAADSSLGQERPKKRVKLSDLSGKKSGLAALLPPPKKVANVPTAPSTTETKSTLPLVPPSVSRAKPSALPADQDFFALPTAESFTSTPTVNSSISISSAPSVKEAPKLNYYATLPTPTPDDPYPGFYCLPTGQWVAKEPEEWSEWASVHGFAQEAQSSAQALGQFEDADQDVQSADAINNMQSFDSRDANKQDKNKPPAIPSKVVPLDAEAEEKKREQLAKFQGRARGKNQLSSLLSDAVRRRDELEERIAVARANKRAGGAKCEFLAADVNQADAGQMASFETGNRAVYSGPDRSFLTVTSRTYNSQHCKGGDSTSLIGTTASQTIR